MKYHLNVQVSAALNIAGEETREMGNNYIGSEHLLSTILKDIATPLSRLLCAQGVYYFRLEEGLIVLFGLKDQDMEELQIAQVMDDILKHRVSLSSRKQNTMMDVNSLTLALLQTDSHVATEILHYCGMGEEAVLLQMKRGSTSELDKISEPHNLNVYGAGQNIMERDAELNFVISILSRKDKASPLLIGGPDVGRTTLVERLTGMIQQGLVPLLKNTCIYELHLNSLIVGTKCRDDFGKRPRNIIRLLERYPNVVLFVDKIHLAISARKSEGLIDVSDVLKSYLTRGIIRCIGATTIEEYEMYIEKDHVLEYRFQTITIRKPDVGDTIKILKAKKKEYEDLHDVKIREKILEQIIKYCIYCMPQREFPDKAIDMLDLACVGIKRWGKHGASEDMIRGVIEKLTDIPLASHNRLQELRKRLEATMVTQKKIICKLMGQLEQTEQGITNEQPLGVWLSLGNQGVGKETLVHQFDRLYSDQENMMELDMAALGCNLDHNLSKLRRNPYTIVNVTNLHTINEAILQFLKQSIEHGYLERDIQEADLRHGIMIMSGDSPYSNVSALKFRETSDPLLRVRRNLGASFTVPFDEVLVSHDPKQKDKIIVTEDILKKWKKTMGGTAILEAVESSSTLDEVTKRLRRKIVKAWCRARLQDGKASVVLQRHPLMQQLPLYSFCFFSEARRETEDFYVFHRYHMVFWRL